MSTTKGRTKTARGLVAAAISLAAIGLSTAESEAAGLQSATTAKINYSTSGWIGDESGSYSGNLSYEGVPLFTRTTMEPYSVACIQHAIRHAPDPRRSSRAQTRRP